MKVGGAYERFEMWPQDIYPNLDMEAERFFSRMTNLDPDK